MRAILRPCFRQGGQADFLGSLSTISSPQRYISQYSQLSIIRVIVMFLRSAFISLCAFAVLAVAGPVEKRDNTIEARQFLPYRPFSAPGQSTTTVTPTPTFTAPTLPTFTPPTLPTVLPNNPIDDPSDSLNDPNFLFDRLPASLRNRPGINVPTIPTDPLDLTDPTDPTDPGSD
ncbi:hypothetical protein EIP91_007402 [Steccherinum ochraceum]|uniref:Uncharacterized protein n=1 Tax=Steccherinum ochraceum TaxID=92696 RepID=A0A4R0RXF0_9APHY|nr:hypothetical protein EIP91_007402 [Steccherinum ochraceum]